MATATPCAVIGVFQDRFAAEQCFAKLLNHGFPRSTIHLMISDKPNASGYSKGIHGRPGSHAGHMAAEGAGIGGAIGAALGAAFTVLVSLAATGFPTSPWNLSAGTMAEPTLAAMGAGMGALAGGAIGGLIGWGIPEPRGRAYCEAISHGGVIISVYAESPRATRDAESVMIECGGHEVCAR